MLVAFVAVLALGALASASASAALPEFGPSKDLPATFTGTGFGPEIEETNKNKYGCSSTTITGVITGPKTVEKVFIKFHGSSNIACGFCLQRSNLGEWRTRELKGSIGYISKTAKTVGLLLEPVTAPIAECYLHNSMEATVLGSVIGGIQNGNKLKEFALSYTQYHGIQSLQHFEGEEAVHNLQIENVFGPVKFGIQGNMTFTTEHELELKA